MAQHLFNLQKSPAEKKMLNSLSLIVFDFFTPDFEILTLIL